MSRIFDRFATSAAWAVGTGYAFGLTVLSTVGWLLAGPFFGWSEAWMIVLTTTYTIYTQWCLNLVQHKQDRDSEAAAQHYQRIEAKVDYLLLSARPMASALSDEDWLAWLAAENQRLRGAVP